MYIKVDRTNCDFVTRIVEEKLWVETKKNEKNSKYEMKGRISKSNFVKIVRKIAQIFTSSKFHSFEMTMVQVIYNERQFSGRLKLLHHYTQREKCHIDTAN